MCSVSKETYEVKWFRGNQEVETGDKYTVVSEGKRRALIVKNCELKDEGGYVAHIGSVKASADLSIIGKLHNSRWLLWPQVKSFNKILVVFQKNCG